jgi:transposase
MRYELTDHEWSAIKPMLPNKPRGVPRVNDRRVLNGFFWVLRSGAPWRDLPQEFGPYTTCYNRFVRWRRAGVWGRIMDALTTAHDAAVQMIDTSIVHRTSPLASPEYSSRCFGLGWTFRGRLRRRPPRYRHGSNTSRRSPDSDVQRLRRDELDGENESRH